MTNPYVFNSKPWNDYSSFIRRTFNERVQKISIDAGFTCPNRDGSKGRGGCIYCENKTFNPFYCTPEKSISQQLDEGIAFFAAKYETQKYIAYFQAFTNTYSFFENLRKFFSEALSHPKVIGLIVATRPDCVDDEILNYLAKLSEKYYVVIEYGIESTENRTLEIINRCHTFEDSVNAIKATAGKGIRVGGHLILGLPGEDKETIYNHAKKISKLPVNFLKIHQLQIIKNTRLAELYRMNEKIVPTYSPDEYIDLVIVFLEYLNPEIVVERFISESPTDMLEVSTWKGIKNFEFTARLEKQMKNRQTWQGRLFI